MMECPTAILTDTIKSICCSCGFAAAEGWLQAYVGSTPTFDLCSFFSTKDLYVVSSDDRAQQPVHFDLVRSHAAQHKLALQLCTKAVSSRQLEWCVDVRGDRLLDLLSVRLRSAIAVPVNRTDDAPIIVLFYSEYIEETGPHLLELLSTCSTVLSSLLMWQQTVMLPSLSTSHLQWLITVASPPAQLRSQPLNSFLYSIRAWAKLSADCLRPSVAEVWLRNDANASKFFVCCSCYQRGSATVVRQSTEMRHVVSNTMCVEAGQAFCNVWRSEDHLRAQQLPFVVALAVPIVIQPSSKSSNVTIAILTLYWQDANALRTQDAVGHMQTLAVASTRAMLFSYVCQQVRNTSKLMASSYETAAEFVDPSILSSTQDAETLVRILSHLEQLINSTFAIQEHREKFCQHWSTGQSVSEMQAAESAQNGPTIASRLRTRRHTNRRKFDEDFDVETPTARRGVVRESSATSSSKTPNSVPVPLRRGKWTKEEEEYTMEIIEGFKHGLLPLPDGTTLRHYLARQLRCVPMRITKKFAKDASIGKQIYKRNRQLRPEVWEEESKKAIDRISACRQRFVRSVSEKSGLDLSAFDHEQYTWDQTESMPASPATDHATRGYSNGTAASVSQPQRPQRPQTPSTAAFGSSLGSSGPAVAAGTASSHPALRGLFSGHNDQRQQVQNDDFEMLHFDQEGSGSYHNSKFDSPVVSSSVPSASSRSSGLKRVLSKEEFDVVSSLSQMASDPNLSRHNMQPGEEKFKRQRLEPSSSFNSLQQAAAVGLHSPSMQAASAPMHDTPSGPSYNYSASSFSDLLHMQPSGSVPQLAYLSAPAADPLHYGTSHASFASVLNDFNHDGSAVTGAMPTLGHASSSTTDHSIAAGEHNGRS